MQTAIIEHIIRGSVVDTKNETHVDFDNATNFVQQQFVFIMKKLSYNNTIVNGASLLDDSFTIRFIDGETKATNVIKCHIKKDEESSEGEELDTVKED